MDSIATTETWAKSSADGLMDSKTVTEIWARSSADGLMERKAEKKKHSQNHQLMASRRPELQ